MLTIADCLKRAAELSCVSDSPRLDLEVLLAAALGRSRAYLYTWPEKILTVAQARWFEEGLSSRRSGQPIAYILGEKEFWSLPLKVNDFALIPRPETELLVERALQLLPAAAQQVVDLGTGSGAIALALASERPQWQVMAIDKYPAVVALAEENRRRLQLHNTVVRQGEWLAGLEAQQQFHLVVSNPPYIDPTDPHLGRGDVRFEPRAALIAENGGLADIQQIARQALPRLFPGGWLLLEHGWEQGGAVRDLFRALGYADVSSDTDLAGMERVTRGRKKSH